MVFDAEVLAITQEAVKQLGFDIETTPVPSRRTRKKDRELEEYIRDKNEALIEANRGLKKEIKRLEREIEISTEKAREAEARAQEAEARAGIAEENCRQSEQRAREAEVRFQRISKKAEQAEIIISTAEDAAGRWEQATFLDKSTKKEMIKQDIRKRHNLQTPFEDFDR